jgi:hypothetical protein
MDDGNYNKNIYIDFDFISATNLKLKTDNDKISEIINQIYERIILLNDDEIWKSSEKDELMNGLMPYLDDTKTSLYDDFNNCLDVLNTALNNYKENDELLNSKINEFLEIVEG